MDSDGGSPVDPDGTGDRFTQGAPEFAAGTVVGHYTIQERIGAGGMGQVYLARDTLLNRSVALKFMSSRDQGDPALKRRFMREARAAASISHPNIVTIFEVSEHDGRPFIAMERVEGRSVDELVAGTPVPIDTVVDIGMQLCEGLKEAHQSGVIHRDIKPANILVDQSGRVRLVDFGLARSEGESRVTQTGETVGTLNYMSPEQLSGKPVDSRSDLFSLGVVLYEMLTGKCPFSGRYGAETLYAIVNLQPERPSALRADVPQRLDDLVMTLLEKEPDARYRSADDVGIDLQSILDEHTGSAVVPPQRVPAIRRLSRLRLVAWTGVALMAVAVIVAVLSGFPRELRIFDSPTDTEALAVMGFQNMEDPEDTARVGQILQELIITDLADVSSIQVIGSQRLFDEQKKLGHTERRGIDQAVATEVARRAGADIMLTGNLMRLGDHWILNCHLVNVGDGTVIISRRIDGEDLYAMVDQLSGQVRTGLSLTSDVPEHERVSVREKTSTSMAAYRHYLAGVDFLNVGSLEPAMAEFEQAIEEDADFHQAFYKLAFAQWWSRDTESRQGSESIERILSEQRYTTDRERRLAEGAQAMLNYRFTDAVAIYEDLSADYPDDKEIWFVLGLAYSNESSLNRVRALAAFEKCIELDLTYVLAYRGIYDLHMARRNYQRAWEMANDLVTIQPDGLMGYRFLVEAAMARGDTSQIRLALEMALTHHKTPEELKGLYMHLGLVGNRISDHRASEKYTRMALAYDPDTTDWHIMAQLGDALFNQGKTAESGRAWGRGHELNPEDTWCLGGLWYVAIKERRYDEAVAYAQHLVELRPQSPRRYGELYESYVHAYRLADADRVLETGLEAIPSVSGKVTLLAHAAGTADLVLGNSRKAEGLFRRALALDTKEVHTGKTGYGVYVGLAHIYRRRRLYDQAEEYAQNALNNDSADQNMLDVLFWSRLYRGDVAEAEATARERIADAPRIAGSYLNLVELHTYLEDTERADSVLEVALAAEPMTRSQANALAFAAGYALEAAQLDRAQALALRALNLAPDRADAISVLGFALELQGRYEEALEQYAKLDPVPVHIVWLGPAYPPGYLQTGCLYLRRGDYASAEEWFRKAETIDPSNTLTLRQLGYLFVAQGRFDTAEVYVRRALERDSSFFNYALMAWILAQRGETLDMAIELGELALSRPPENDPHDLYVTMLPSVPLPDHALGRAFYQKSAFERAVMHLQRAADLRPDDEAIASDLREAKMRLQG